MKRTAIDINSEMVKNCGTWTFSFNKQLEQNQHKFILKLPRQQQRMLHKIRLSSKTYSQIKGQEEMCPYCENPFTNRAKHWCINCSVIDFERRNIQDYLTEEQVNLQDFKLVTAILNSQNSRKYKELLKLLKKFPF